MVPAKFVIGKRARTSQDDVEPSSDSPKASWNTQRTDAKPSMTYAGRMALTMALSAVMTVLVLVVVLAVVWEGQFQRYTRENMERLATSTADTLSAQYQLYSGWTNEVLARAASSASSSDVGLQVLDQGGNVIYDDTWAMTAAAPATVTTVAETSDATAAATAGAATTVPATTAATAPATATTTSRTLSLTATGASLAPTSQESIVTASVVDAQGNVVGTVRVWAFGSDALLTKSDATFRNNSYQAIFAAAVIAVVLASLLGLMASRSLSKPIKRITSTAAQIRNGDLTARTGLKGDDEIGQLGETFDDMANSLEKDLKLEHRLTSDVAHELRTPLMAMLATVEAMQDGVLPCDEERLETVASEVRRLSRLVDAMLQLSRIENGSTKLKVERTDLVGLVRGMVTAQEQLFADRNLRLRFTMDLPHKECYANVDRDLVRQAVINLMSNAMRYTPEGGWVVVNIAQDRSDALITVSDTGIGIAKEDLSQVFSRFWRSDASRERASGGLGVGLSVTKEIVDRHHGFISVESELGKGTAFTLHLPREHRGTIQGAVSEVAERGATTPPRQGSSTTMEG